MMLGTAGSALAHVCFNSSKPAGKGSAGSATIDVTTGEFTIRSMKLNPQGRPTGGFLTVTAVAGETTLGSFDTFTHTTLPDGAMNAGPGDSECDGVGIDKAEACAGP